MVLSTAPSPSLCPSCLSLSVVLWQPSSPVPFRVCNQWLSVHTWVLMGQPPGAIILKWTISLPSQSISYLQAPLLPTIHFPCLCDRKEDFMLIHFFFYTTPSFLLVWIIMDMFDRFYQLHTLVCVHVCVHTRYIHANRLERRPNTEHLCLYCTNKYATLRQHTPHPSPEGLVSKQKESIKEEAGN